MNFILVCMKGGPLDGDIASVEEAILNAEELFPFPTDDATNRSALYIKEIGVDGVLRLVHAGYRVGTKCYWNRGISV